MEVDEEKPTPAATTPASTDQDLSSSQTQKSKSASDGPEDTAPVTENAGKTEVRNNLQLLQYACFFVTVALPTLSAPTGVQQSKQTFFNSM